MSQPLQVDVQTAYAEACAALGDSLTQNRLLRRHIADLEQRLALYAADLDRPAGVDPATADVT